jgi:hypothetical protein
MEIKVLRRMGTGVISPQVEETITMLRYLVFDNFDSRVYPILYLTVVKRLCESLKSYRQVSA